MVTLASTGECATVSVAWGWASGLDISVGESRMGRIKSGAPSFLLQRTKNKHTANRTFPDASEKPQKRLETPKSELRSEGGRFWVSKSAEHPPPSDVPGNSYLENQVDTSPGGPRSAGASTDGYTPGNLPHSHKRNTPLNATVRLTVFTVTLLSGRENAR